MSAKVPVKTAVLQCDTLVLVGTSLATKCHSMFNIYLSQLVLSSPLGQRIFYHIIRGLTEMIYIEGKDEYTVANLIHLIPFQKFSENILN